MSFRLSAQDERRKIAPLAVSFGCALGCYWMLRGMKNAIFLELVGREYLPHAKLVSISALVLLLFGYSWAVDRLGKRRLLFIVYAVYAGLFAFLTWALAHRDEAALGWGFYLAVETFGSLGISHLWSLAISATPDPELARRRFPMLVVGGELGSTSCNALTFLLAPRVGLTPLLCIAVALLCLAPLSARGWLARNHVEDSVRRDGDRAGMAEGLRLIFARPYLLGILTVVMGYEFVGTFLDFQMNSTVGSTLHGLAEKTRFLALYGFLANSVSLVFAYTGTGGLVRRFGVRRCLVWYPLLLAVLVGVAAGWPALATLIVCMVVLKGVAYGFNKPCLEMLYVPTSESIQFKAKSWIDTAGSRGGKALGSLMNMSLPAASLLGAGAGVCFALIAGWVGVANLLGRRHAELVDRGERLT